MTNHVALKSAFVTFWGSHLGPLTWALGGGEGTNLGLYIANVWSPCSDQGLSEGFPGKRRFDPLSSLT